jgi:hypothetical protein
MSDKRFTDPRRPSEAVLDPSTAAPHPEEMRTTVEIRIGSWFSLRATARATPAGLIATALLVTAILVPVLRFANRAR